MSSMFALLLLRTVSFFMVLVMTFLAAVLGLAVLLLAVFMGVLFVVLMGVVLAVLFGVEVTLRSSRAFSKALVNGECVILILLLLLTPPAPLE